MINKMISNETELNTMSLNARRLFKNKFKQNQHMSN